MAEYSIEERLARLEAVAGEMQSLRQQLAEVQRHRWELQDRVNHLSEYGIGGRSDKADQAEAQFAYASLGWNCEAAYQFRRAIGADRSSFFNWTYCLFRPMLDIIERDFEGLLKWENLAPSGVMILDRGGNFAFHGSVFNKTERGKFVELSKYHLASLQSKTIYLIEKWRRLTASGAFVTYFLKLPDMEGRREAACSLRDLLARKYPAHKFQIVVLGSLESGEAAPDWGEPGIHNRYLDRFAPDSDPNDGDAASWDRVFAEFPLQA